MWSPEYKYKSTDRQAVDDSILRGGVPRHFPGSPEGKDQVSVERVLMHCLETRPFLRRPWYLICSIAGWETFSHSWFCEQMSTSSCIGFHVFVSSQLREGSESGSASVSKCLQPCLGLQSFIQKECLLGLQLSVPASLCPCFLLSVLLCVQVEIWSCYITQAGL